MQCSLVPPALWAGWFRVLYLPSFPPGRGLPLPLPLPHDLQPPRSRHVRASVWCFFGCLLRFFFRIALRHRFGIDFWTILDLQHLPKSIQNRSKSYQLYVMTLYLRMARCSYDPLSFWPPALMASSANVWCCIALRCVVLLRVLFLCCVLLSCLMLFSVAFPVLCCSVR